MRLFENSAMLSPDIMHLKLKSSKGVTLIELMIASAIFTVGVLGLISSFSFINQSIQKSKSKSLASNVAQEKIENLKNHTYARLIVTTDTAASACDASLLYDTGYFPKETINVGGIPFERAVYIRKVSETSGGDLEYRGWDDPDTGMKEVLVHVFWKVGNTCQTLSLRNLRNDPARLAVDASFGGHVTCSGADLENARVKVLQNPSWGAYTNSSGIYSFYVAEGTYTLSVSKDGYFPQTMPDLTVVGGGTSGQDFALVRMDSGTIVGTAWVNDRLLISQVVGSSVSGAVNQMEEHTSELQS
ncbi:MAG: carboxypeptidase regulatory-like domain-containing protein, partial [bacterium]